MKTIITRLLVGIAGLAIASVPLAASAQTFHGDDRGGYRADFHGGPGYRGGPIYRGGPVYIRHWDRPDWAGYVRPPFRRHYWNGYYGPSPVGFQGYFWNGNWYHHRRWNGGVWFYF